MERAYNNYPGNRIQIQDSREEKETLKKLAATLMYIQQELQEHTNHNRYLEKLAVSGILVPWVMTIPFTWLPARKGVGLLLISAGILAVTGLFVGWSVRREKRKYWRLIGKSTAAIRERAFRESCHRYDLSKREIQVVQLYREGIVCKQIAGKLFISPSTVAKHIENIYRKVGVHCQTELLYRMEFKEANKQPVNMIKHH